MDVLDERLVVRGVHAGYSYEFRNRCRRPRARRGDTAVALRPRRPLRLSQQRRRRDVRPRGLSDDDDASLIPSQRL